jgi:hypothetical protein
VASPSELSFRFRPRFQAIPWIVASVGAAMLAYAVFARLDGASRTFALVAGAIGPFIALAYLRSPAWKLVVVVDEVAFEVRGGEKIRFRLEWTEVKELVYSTKFPTAFLDGGVPERSLLIPGPGAPAPYRIERSEELVAFVRARVPAEKQRIVDPP